MPLRPITSIDTDRVSIRPVAFSDLQDLLAINGDEAVTRFLPYATWRNMEDAIAWLARMDALAGTGTGTQLVIAHKVDRKTIGTILLFKFDEASSRIELGYVLARAYWSQGLAREALHAVCDHVFRHLLIRRIEAEVNPDNAPSNALLLALGFSREGLLRQRWVAKGAPYDTHIYGCLSQDWLHRRTGSE